jgi:hypothetical protein
MVIGPRVPALAGIERQKLLRSRGGETLFLDQAGSKVIGVRGAPEGGFTLS